MTQRRLRAASSYGFLLKPFHFAEKKRNCAREERRGGEAQTFTLAEWGKYAYSTY